MAKKNTKVKDNPLTELEAQERLAQVMNDTPILLKTSIGTFQIKALKPAVQWLIAEKTVEIQKSEDKNMADLIKHFAQSIPSVVSVLTMAILNEKNKIFTDFDTRTYSEEYRALYDKIMWETDQAEWIDVLLKVLNMLSFDFFFTTTNLMDMMRKMTLNKKMTQKERMEQLRSMSLAEQNGDK